MSELSTKERLMRLMLEVSPFRVGHLVTVSPSFKYASDWPGTYIITGMSWDYQRGDGHEINITIASEDDIVKRCGPADGFRTIDLIPAYRS